MSSPASNGADDDATLLAPKTGDEEVDLPEELAEHLDRPLSPGDRVGEYEIGDKLGEGGFGTVYRAIHPLIGKSAAVKVLSREFSSNPQIVSRFIAEARAANTIRHANIIDIFNFGTLEDGRHYFVMELLDGVSLEDFLCQRGAVEPPLALQIMAGVAQALDAAHDKGIVHRDLKPDNIFLSFDDQGQPIPKLLDFGIAKLLGDAATISGHRTRTGTPIGTPHYMSPEQCLGEAVDEQADVYGFGIVCYEALTGGKPFEAESFLKLMNLHATGERPLASEANPALGTAFDQPLARMLAIAKAERPPTIGAALDLLQEAAQAAGFEVDTPQLVSVSQRAPRGSAAAASLPSPVISGAVSAASAAENARTVSAEIPAPASGSPRRRWLLSGALVIGVAVIGLTAFGLGGDESKVEPPTPGSAAAPITPTTSLTASTTPSGSSAEKPARITFRIETNAKGARAFLGDRELGSCPGQVTIADPGDQPATLVVKAPGHHDGKATVTPKEGGTVTINLKAKGGGTPIDGDLADPKW